MPCCTPLQQAPTPVKAPSPLPPAIVVPDVKESPRKGGLFGRKNKAAPAPPPPPPAPVAPPIEPPVMRCVCAAVLCRSYMCGCATLHDIHTFHVSVSCRFFMTAGHLTLQSLQLITACCEADRFTDSWCHNRYAGLPASAHRGSGAPPTAPTVVLPPLCRCALSSLLLNAQGEMLGGSDCTRSSTHECLLTRGSNRWLQYGAVRGPLSSWPGMPTALLEVAEAKLHWFL